MDLTTASKTYQLTKDQKMGSARAYGVTDGR